MRAKRLRFTVSDGRATRATRDTEAKTWFEENRDEIDEYNSLVAKRGVFGDGRRRF